MQKIYRLTQRGSFNYIYKKGKRSFDKLLILYYVEAYNLKLGVSVNKKVGNSVVRNKVKRRIKEAFRQIIPLIKPSYNMVISAREGIERASYAEIRGAIERVLQKEKLFIEQGMQ
jgi:ribonuclease P protein component